MSSGNPGTSLESLVQGLGGLDQASAAASWLEARSQERKPDSPRESKQADRFLQLGRDVSICVTSWPQRAALWEKGPGSQVKRLTGTAVFKKRLVVLKPKLKAVVQL